MNLSRYCRGSIDDKNTSMDQESIGQTESFLIDRETVEKLSRQILESSLDRNCANFCRERNEGLNRCKFVEDLSRSCRAWRKGVFQREEKHIEMNATSKLLNHRSNQHVKLSKTSFNKKIQSIHDPEHTHTLNKFNQFYISKTS